MLLSSPSIKDSGKLVFFPCQGSWDFLNSAFLLKMIIFLLCIQSCACCITAVRVVTVCRCVMNMPTAVRHEENTFISHTLPLGLLCKAAIFLCYKSVWLTVQEKVITHSCFALKHNYMYIWAHRQRFPASEYRSLAAYGGAFCINMCTVSRLSGRFFSLWMLNTFLIRFLCSALFLHKTGCCSKANVLLRSFIHKSPNR